MSRKIGYVFGGTVQERMKETEELKEKYGCYMTLSSFRKNKKFLDFITGEHSGRAIIVSLQKDSYVEFL